MGRLMLVGLLAFAVALTGTAAFAEVQNVKVSGDIDLKALIHNNYDLKLKQKNEPGPGTSGGTTPVVTNDDNASFFLSTAHISVDADLTDNVATHVRLLNQRVWDAAADDEDQVSVDNAYVVLKEFLYSPLTVMVGRQDLEYGTGFIVGPGRLADPNGVFTGLGTGVHAAGIGAEFSALNSYDAIRLILDYSPVTVEGLISKINETGVTDDDANLYSVYVSYKTPDYNWWKNGVVEPYWIYKDDEASTLTTNDSRATGTTVRTYDINRVHTFGLRAAGSPMENLAFNAEWAYQLGEIKDIASATEVKERKRNGIGANVDVRYNWVQVPWTPATGVGWVYYSGESASGESGVATIAQQDSGDTFNAWDPVYRGAFHTYIQDFFTGRDAPAGLYTTFDGNDTAATTNRHLLYFDVGLSPLQDVKLWARYTHAWFAHHPRPGRSNNAGDEVDVKATYDYTDDVQLAMWGGWFFPGTYYDQPVSSSRGNDLAWTLGSSAKVKF